MDVCFVSDLWGRPNPTGVGIYTERVLEHVVAALGPDARCVGLGFREAAPPRVPPGARLRYAQAAGPSKLAYLRWLAVGAERDIARAASSTAVVHALQPLPPWTTRRPWVVTVHDLSPILFADQYPPRQIRKFTLSMRAAVRHGAHFLAISRTTAEDLRRVYDLPAERVSVVPNGFDAERVEVDAARRAEITARLGLPPRFFAYVGNLNRRKNLVALVRAYASVADQLDGVHLVLAGNEQLGADEVRAAIAAERVGDRVHLPGYVDRADALALMAMSEAFVFPSLYEGFGLPLLEAMVQGTPVVAAAGGSVPEVAGDAALVTDPADVEGLAANLVRVVAEPGLRADLVGRGHRRAATFSWSRMARETVAVYERMLGAG